jgi:transcriptional regulator with XRE-family HTH domain
MAELETLGSRLRHARVARGISARKLAQELKCSPSHVSQIERDITAPSVSMLTALVSHLGVSMESLFSSDDTGSTPRRDASTAGVTALTGEQRVVQRAAQRAEIRIQHGVTSQLLLPQPEDGADFCEYIYEPGHAAGQNNELLQHPGREHGLVLEGELTVRLEFEVYVLGEGDSIAFYSSVPHRYWNASDSVARAVWFSSTSH